MSSQVVPQGQFSDFSEQLPTAAPAPFVFKTPVHFAASDIKILRPEIERLAKLNTNVVVDFARTESIDGSGVGALVFVFKRLAAKGRRLSIRNVSGQPLSLLNAAGLLRTLSVERPEGLVRATLRRLRLFRTAQGPSSLSTGASDASIDAGNQGAA